MNWSVKARVKKKVMTYYAELYWKKYSLLFFIQNPMKLFYVTAFVIAFSVLWVFGLWKTQVMADVWGQIMDTTLWQVKLIRYGTNSLAAESMWDKSRDPLVVIWSTNPDEILDEATLEGFKQLIKKTIEEEFTHTGSSISIWAVTWESIVSVP